ncbi:MAG: HEAT repeat domain-containing protein, partial [Phycisphaerae bacterium]|nr:HEAT repeat domain-containing protein [Phycisphaerae bacterium]
ILRTRRGGKIRFTERNIDGSRRYGGYYSDTFLRWETVKVLAEVGRERAVPALIEALDDPDDGVVHNAARALGELGDKRAIKPLGDVMLKHDGKRARAGAFIGLYKLGERPAFLPGLELLKNVRNDTRRQEVAEILASLANNSHIDSMITQLLSKDRVERTAAAMVLGYTKNPRAVEPLIGRLGATSIRNQRVVAETLGRIGDARAVAPLCDLLKDKNKQLVRAAAKALGNIGDKRAVGPLLEALAGPSLKQSSWTRKVIADALAQIGDPRVLKDLLKSMKSNCRIADAVAAMKDKRTIKPLWEAWRRANYSHERFAVIKALVRLDPKNSIERLEKTAIAEHSDVYRAEAIKILGDLGDRRSISVLKRAMRDERSRVRAAAREALKKIMGEKGT